MDNQRHLVLAKRLETLLEQLEVAYRYNYWCGITVPKTERIKELENKIPVVVNALDVAVTNHLQTKANIEAGQTINDIFGS